MSRDYLHPDQPIDKHGVALPHWEQDEVMQFVTFRLGDPLPKGRIQQWKHEKAVWESTWRKPWTPEQQAEYNRRFVWRLEEWLDEGVGSCLLKESLNREVLEGGLKFDEGKGCEHHAWVIMPNHVHLLFKPFAPLESLIQAWKSISAKRIGKGSIWQPNYRDTLIRSSEHFVNAVRYIRRNPVKAHLREGSYSLWESPRAASVSDRDRHV